MNFSIKKFFLSFTTTYRAALISGVLFGTSYIPLPPWALFFCLVPLWNSWRTETSLKKVFLSGWITQFVFTLIGFHWIAHTTVEFGHMPWGIGIITLFLFCAHASLQIPIAGVVWARFFKDKGRLSSYVGLALLTFLFECLYPQIFWWNFGYPWFWAKLPAYNFADIIGFQGLSALTLIINALFLYCFLSKSHKKKYSQLIAGLIIFNLAGYFWGLRWPKPDSSVKISIIQANIGNFEKFASETNSDFRTPIVQKYFELTRRSLQSEPNPDFILWPETAFPSNLHESARSRFFQSQLRTFISSTEKPFLAGGYTELPNDGPYYNSLFYFNSKGEIQEAYNKSHLLAFGEYFPGSEYFPFLKNLIPEVSDFGRGQGPSILTHTFASNEQLKIGPQICYEGLFPNFSKGLSNKGAQIMVNVTNDSWFGHTFESYQHLYMTLARAIEYRRPLVRSTNTGISAVVTADGKVILQSPQEKEWFATIDVPYQKQPEETFYAHWGFYLTYALSALGLIVSYLRSHVFKP